MIVLYEHPLSPFAQKVKIALAEKGIEYESKLPDLFGGTDADFTAANPRREVPALVDGETKVFDSTIILEYIEDKWPNPPLLPKSPADRARCRMLEDLCDTYYEPINWGAFEIRAFGRATAELAEKMLARASEQIAGVNSYLEHQLGTRQFFNGDSFGWGDLSVAPYVHAAAFSGNAPAPDSRLGKWLERVRARPSVSIVFQQALDSMSAVSVIPQLIASGQFVREYRDHRLEWMLRSGGLEIVLEGMQKKNIRFTHELR